jgi:lipopolysaccharide transport system ATP-binding protein
VAVIGGNGAGKSTLFRILSRVTPPTTGEARLSGRIASLLEVGTGFHPELTGRENVFLNAAILGMKPSEVRRRLDAIVEYAGIASFIDTPIKHYSSGMAMRLAFSVAAHLESDILLVDEVLAVGDAEFQRRCLGTMAEAARGGRTVLLVSHNMTAVSSLCSRALYLEGGRLEYDGAPSGAIALYSRSRAASSYELAAPAGQGPTIAAAFVESQGERAKQLVNGEPFTLVVETASANPVPAELAVAFFDDHNRKLWNFTNRMFAVPPFPGARRLRIELRFQPPRLSTAFLTVHLALQGQGCPEHHVPDAFRLSLSEGSGGDHIATDCPLICEPRVSCRKEHSDG